MNAKYQSIRDLPYPAAQTRQPMPMRDRAAQFAPFAALTGYDEAVDETARLTTARIEQDEQQQQYLNDCMQQLLEDGSGTPVTVTYFIPDTWKPGGKYVSVSGEFRRIDEQEHLLLLRDGERIPLMDIYDIRIDA